MQNKKAYYQKLLLHYIDNSPSTEEVDDLFNFIKKEPGLYREIINSPEVMDRLENLALHPKHSFNEPDRSIRERLFSVPELAGIYELSKAPEPAIAPPGKLRSI